MSLNVISIFACTRMILAIRVERKVPSWPMPGTTLS